MREKDTYNIFPELRKTLPLMRITFELNMERLKYPLYIIGTGSASPGPLKARASKDMVQYRGQFLSLKVKVER